MSSYSIKDYDGMLSSSDLDPKVVRSKLEGLVFGLPEVARRNIDRCLLNGFLTMFEGLLDSECRAEESVIYFTETPQTIDAHKRGLGLLSIVIIYGGNIGRLARLQSRLDIREPVVSVAKEVFSYASKSASIPNLTRPDLLAFHSWVEAYNASRIHEGN